MTDYVYHVGEQVHLNGCRDVTVVRVVGSLCFVEVRVASGKVFYTGWYPATELSPFNGADLSVELAK